MPCMWVSLPTLDALRITAKSWASYLHFYYPTKVAYLLLVSLVGAGVLCALDGVSYLDAFYQTMSAVTSTGLVSIDMSTLSGGSQVTIFFIILAGGTLLGSVAMPLTRWWHVRAALIARAAETKHALPRSAHAEHTEHQLVAARTLLRDALWVAVLVILGYWAAVQLALFAVLAIYTSSAQGVRAVLAARGVSPLWFSAFHAVSVFNNSGMTLFTDNLVSFVEDRALLLTLSFTIPLGNVAAPVALHALLRLGHALLPRSPTLDFLVRHPRVAFYNVFDAPATLQLATWVGLFAVFQFVSFLATDFNKGYLHAFPPPSRALIALFSAISTRTAGFNVVNMIDTSVSQQVVCAALIYLSATPLLAALAKAAKDEQRANPDADHLEDSLLVFVQNNPNPTMDGPAAAAATAGAAASSSSSSDGAAKPPQQDELRGGGRHTAPTSSGGGSSSGGGGGGGGGGKVLLQGLQSALPYDTLLAVASKEGPLLLLALLLICYAEDEALGSPTAPREVSVFGFAFELSSAFGTNGLTLSPRALATSAYFGKFARLLVIGIMLAGRMRGLPWEVDKLAMTHSLWEEGEGGRMGSWGRRSKDGGLEEEGGSHGSEVRLRLGEGGSSTTANTPEAAAATSSPRSPPHGRSKQKQLKWEKEEGEEGRQQQEPETVRDGHAFTVGVKLLLGGGGGGGGARQKHNRSMRNLFSREHSDGVDGGSSTPEGGRSPNPAASPRDVIAGVGEEKEGSGPPAPPAF